MHALYEDRKYSAAKCAPAIRYSGVVAWLDELVGDTVAPGGLREWAAQHSSRAEAWKQCPRGDWQLWLAAHAPALTPPEQRNILARALEIVSVAPSTPWVASGWRPLPTSIDLVDAWAYAHGDRLGPEQGLVASNTAFLAALVIGIVVDRLWLGRFGHGVSRTLMQAVVCTAVWLLLVPVMRAIWLTRIRRRLSGLSFEAAFALIWGTVARLMDADSVEERAKWAESVRINLYNLGRRAFA